MILTCNFKYIDVNYKVQIPSPLEEIKLHPDYKIYVKRDDLIHPFVSGNKYRKLKFNIIEAQKSNYNEIISFGGAFSNHLHALSFICHQNHIPLRLFIRGEKVENPTIKFIKEMGAKLHFIDRNTYTKRNDLIFLNDLQNQFSGSFIIPEGGTNSFALLGMAELVNEIQSSLGNEKIHYCASFGSGGTSIGMLKYVTSHDKVHIFPALKFPNIESGFNEIRNSFNVEQSNFCLHGAYHFGGFARYNDVLITFINKFKELYHIQLDPLYTGKLFYGVIDLLNKGYFPIGDQIVIVHTGGLQGISGFNERFGNLLK